MRLLLFLQTTRQVKQTALLHLQILRLQIFMLYPVNDEMRISDSIRFDSGDGTVVNLFFVDVANIEENMRQLKSLLEEVI